MKAKKENHICECKKENPLHKCKSEICKCNRKKENENEK